MKHAETVTQQGTASIPSDTRLLPGRNAVARQSTDSHRKWIYIFLARVRRAGRARRMMQTEQSVRAAKRPRYARTGAPVPAYSSASVVPPVAAKVFSYRLAAV